MKNIASVVISNCTREFDKEYHYIIPEEIKGNIKVGMRVIIPFGRTNTLKEAYVVDLLKDSNWNKLKSIMKLIDEEPVLSKDMLDLAFFMKDRYICTYHDAIKCMLPAGTGIKAFRNIVLKKEIKSLITESNKSTGLESIKLKDLKKNINENEEKIINILLGHGDECEYTDLKRESNIRTFQKHIDNLKEKGIVSIQEEYTTRVKEKFIRVAYPTLPKEEIIELIEGNKLKRIQQIKVMEILMDNEFVSIQDVVRFAGVSPGVLDTLNKYGYIDFKNIEVKRDPFSNKYYEDTIEMKPTAEQGAALKILETSVDKNKYKEYLLHGITGSGKTEVYMQLINYSIQLGKNTIVLVPEISLTPQIMERFRGRFGDKVAILHSRLTLGERYDQWRLIHKGEKKVVIGARSAIFAPLKNIGLIIIDEEHEGSYKSEITPKYHAIEIARYICKQQGGVLLLGSATPSIETYYRANEGKIGLLEIKERVNKALLPEVTLIDMREELKTGNRSVFSKKLEKEISKNIELGQQAMLFLNRRGHSSFVLCRNCGYVVKCIDCSISLTYHAVGERLTCHYCGYTRKPPRECPKCKSKYIRHFGLGTQRLEEETIKQFPKGTVIRMDSDTTGYKDSHADILDKFRKENINIMVGTQMIAKGHDFPNVTLVGVMAADGMLGLGDFRASEKTFQLLTQVAGRAGRGELEGRVIIQSYNIDDFSILAACKQDYKEFYEQEIKIRKEMMYPPFTNIALVVMRGINNKMVQRSSTGVKSIIDRRFGENTNIEGLRYEILGPLKPPIAKIKNKYRWRLVIKCNNISVLTKILRETSDEFYKGKTSRTVDLGVDINPINML